MTNTELIASILNRQNDPAAMKSACGEYECPCHDLCPELARRLRASEAEIERFRLELYEAKGEIAEWRRADIVNHGEGTQ